MRINKNNVAYLCGTISPPGISLYYTYKYTDYYILYLDIKRLSDAVDRVPVVITQDMYDEHLDELRIGTRLNVVAELRSFNKTDETGKHHVNVYANACKLETVISVSDRNDVYMQCKVCKPTNTRKTPNGKRITDLMLAVSRIPSKKDYIPAIAWGSVADLSANITVEDTFTLQGRFQSRSFIKKTENDQYINGISYEVSINNLELIRDENNNTDIQKKEGI